ncbi:MAG: DUF2726 domain-containing protein [Vitreimonas sp.]
MSPDFIAPSPYQLIAVFAAGVLLGMAVERLIAQARRQAWRTKKERESKGFSRQWPPPSQVSTKPDAAEQLRIVMTAEFTTQPLLNKGEARVFKELDQIVTRCNPVWRVMAQVSLGEILRSKDANAFGCINAKRVDMLLIDEHCHPRHAIEYQGRAHHQGAAAARDAVKKEALRRAGIGYHEVVAGQTTPSELRLLIERLVAKPEWQH